MLLTQATKGVEGLHCCWIGSCRTHKHTHAHTLSITWRKMLHFTYLPSCFGTHVRTCVREDKHGALIESSTEVSWCSSLRACVSVCVWVYMCACMRSSDGQRPFMLLSWLHSGAAAEINMVRGETSCVQQRRIFSHAHRHTIPVWKHTHAVQFRKDSSR